MRGPTAKVKKQLEHALVEYFARAPLKIKAIEFLFKQSKKKPNLDRAYFDDEQDVDRIDEREMSQALGSPRRSDSNIRGLMSRLFDEIGEFFRSSQGKGYEWTITRPQSAPSIRDRGNYRLRFEPRTQQDEFEDIVSMFWRPHLQIDSPILVLYPELKCMMDTRTNTYFPNSYLEPPEILASVGMTGQEQYFRNSTSMVSAGVIAGILSTVSCLTNLSNSRFAFRVIRLHTGFDQYREERNFVLFGTPSSTKNLIAELEEKGMSTTKTGIVVRLADGGAETYQDRDEGESSFNATITQIKYGVLTRRPHPAKASSPITIVAGKHGRAVQGIADYLKEPTNAQQLARMCGNPKAFPQRFQALFEVELRKAPEGEPTIVNTRVVRVWT